MVATIATAASAAYYIESQQSHRHPNQYYIGGKEPDGVWWNPTGLFGLEDGGKVDSRDFQHLYNGFAPDDMRALTRNAGSDKRSAGMDLTFSADKSVSALWALVDRDTRNVIEAVQQDAARFALDFIIRGYCAYTRIRHPDGELEVLPADILGATFQHGSSRANDPQLHTHCVIFNVARTHDDGKFRALHGRPLFRWKKAAGAVYRAALAWNLQQRIGVQMEQYGTHNEFTRVAGMPENLLKHWSKRRHQIESFAALLGFDTSDNAARAAAINKLTRDTKDTDSDAAQQLDRWQAEAHDLIADLEQTLADVLGREIHIEPEQIRNLTDVLDQLPAMLTKHEAVFALPDVVEWATNACASLTTQQAFQTYIDRVVASPALIRLDISETSADANAGLHHTHFFTSRSTLQMENAVHELAKRSIADRRYGIPTITTVNKISELRSKNYPLSNEQLAAIRHATSPQRTAIIEGAAGAGKTTTLRPIADLYREAGYTVLGTAVAWRAAIALGNDCNIDHYCVAMLTKLSEKNKLNLNPKTVIIVDEAGTLCTQQALSLLQLSETYGPKIVWAGDTHQQQPVDAGPGLRLISEVTGSIRVDMIRRQKADIEDILVHHQGQTLETARLHTVMISPSERDRIMADFEALPDDQKPNFKPWMVEASEALRDHHIRDAIDAYRERGRFHICHNLSDTLKLLVDHWYRFQRDHPHKSCVVLAQSHKEVDVISHLLRARLHANSEDNKKVIIQACRGREDNPHATPLEIRRGDRLRIGTTNWKHHLFNRSIVTVEDFRVQRSGLVGPKRVLITGHTEQGHKVVFYHDDIKDRFGNVRLDHAFALTISAAQGLTVDQTFLYADTQPSVETIYPAATRHREGLDIYVDRKLVEVDISDARADSDRNHPVSDDEIVDHLAKRWSRSQPKASARDHSSQELLLKHSNSTERADPAAWLAANDNGNGILKAAARAIRNNTLDLRYGDTVAAVAAARTDVLASYDDLRTQTRQQGIAVAASDAFAETLARHGRALEQAKQFRKNPARFATLLARRGRLTATDLNDFAALRERASTYRRRALAQQSQKAMQQDAEKTQQAGESASPTDTAASGSGRRQRGNQERQVQRYSRAAELSAQLALRAEEVCRHYLPQGKKNGKWWLIGSIDGEPGQSLFVHLTGNSQGKWRDSATSESGDMLDLIQAAGRFQKVTETMDEARRFLGQQPAPAPEAAQRYHTTPTTDDGDGRRRAQRLFDHARPVTNTDPAGRYLQNRGLSLADADDLRFTPTALVKLGDDLQKLPAVLVPIRALDGKLESVQRIFITNDGHRADIPSPKRYTASPATGAVWFGNPKANTVVLCEGVEDALSITRVLSAQQKRNLAVVASTSAGRLATVALPENVSQLVLIQDRDQAGERAWTNLQAKYADSAISLRRFLPEGKDANEDLLQRGADALRRMLAPLTQDLQKQQTSAQHSPSTPVVVDDADNQVNADRQQARQAFNQLVKDWKAHEQSARNVGARTIEHAGYAPLRARMEVLAAAKNLDADSQHKLNRALSTLDQAIGNRQQALEAAARQTPAPDPDKLRQIEDHLTAVTTLGRTHDLLEKAADNLGLRFDLCSGSRQWRHDSETALSQSEAILKDPAFATEIKHRDTALRLSQGANQLREHHADADKLIAHGRAEHLRQKEANQNAVTPEQRQARVAYHELMRRIKEHQGHAAERGLDPIRHYNYQTDVQNPTRTLIDNPHLDAHTRDWLKELLERQIVVAAEWQREHKQQQQQQHQSEQQGLSIKY